MQLRSAQKLESAAVQGLVKMVSLDGQRTEHRLSNLALIAPSPIRRTAKPVGLAATYISRMGPVKLSEQRRSPRPLSKQAGTRQPRTGPQTAR
jgi:hypothetical protein